MNQKLFSSHLKYRSYSHPGRIPYHFSNFQVKAIITQHSNNSPSFDLYKPSVVKGDGKSYHRNPINSYVSKLPDGFFGCLGCRYNSHIFREYKYYRDKVIRSIYWQELWAHVPKMRTKSRPTFTPEVSANSFTFYPPPPFASYIPHAPSSSNTKHGIGL